ncbi:leucine-rich repeat-containing protein 74A-like [Melitaea cinxia]|uniref:leucine-rich repeat-containing protein 74A-like n=1 Tax=Melitaea cinxia TaxID=113334 RepID=UPI001E272792|nr:leucine-rich repeat-containing protein 74A-like [Melitaea cinxia]
MSSKSIFESPQEQKVPEVRFFYKALMTLSSSEDPTEDWMSLPSSENTKMTLYKQGLYDPGSGEICTKYIPMSDSTVIRHPYYAYPGIKDPGITEALLEPEPIKTYSLDGRELYLDLCEEMKVIPVRSFLRGLLGEVIDLKYYGVNPNSVRAMTMALTNNRYVRRLDLSSNFLNDDACYHLGQMMGENIILQELILSGCRIQAEGVKRLVIFFASRFIEELDLSRNDIGDRGFEYLAHQLVKGAVIKKLNLSSNDLSSAVASSFAAAIEGNNKTTHLDLSWNKMFSLKGKWNSLANKMHLSTFPNDSDRARNVNELLGRLGESKVLVELNMSWNSLKISRILRRLLAVQTLRILDLSNNRLGKLAATTIASNLESAKSLHTLDLSFNPITAEGAFAIVNKLRNMEIKLRNLLMDNVEVNKEFVKEYREVLELSYRKKCNITHGNVKHDYTLSVPDIREIILKRMDFLTARSSKKIQLDIALYFLQKKKVCDNIQPREILRDMKMAGTPLDEDLVVGLTDIFPGPKLDKGGKTLDLTGVVEMIQRLWPDRKLPPTPEPEKVPEKPKKKGKKKK